MAVATAAASGGRYSYLPSKFSIAAELKQRNPTTTPRPPPPILISTNRAHVNIVHLRELYALCNHSCHRFPVLDAHGNVVDPLDDNNAKLRTALSHSAVVVSAFTKPQFLTQSSEATSIAGEWIRRLAPGLTPENGRLIGFGRAVSDLGLTASIYDVMVHPALQGRGIGRMIVQRIIRMLTNRGVYDIAALCNDKERQFFRACGFGEDVLGSTTMMYARAASSVSKDDQMMGRKLWVEVCLVSARGLRRTSSLFKLQWFAVGWIYPEDKYCTKIDTSGNSNPVWKTKFSTAIDAADSNFQDLALHVEVYSREPIFLRQSLLGTATIVLKEFLDKYNNAKSEVSKPVEEVGSFQLRKKNSNKPQGFVDVSIRISEERGDTSSSYLGSDEGFNLADHGRGINLGSGPGSLQSHMTHLPQTTSQKPESINLVPVPPTYSNQPGIHKQNYPLSGGPSYGQNYASSSGPSYGQNYPSPGGPSYGQNYPSPGGLNYRPPRVPPPPPPPPPSNVGYIPNFFPGTNSFTPSYINMPSSTAAAPRARGSGPGFGMGLGAGALAAGAVVFGDDFISGFDIPGGLPDASVTISTNPPF